MKNDELAERISGQSGQSNGIRIDFKDIRITRLRSKIFYISKLSMRRTNSITQQNGRKLNEVESIKKLLAYVYVSQSLIMAFTLRNITNQKALRSTFNRIQCASNRKHKVRLFGSVLDGISIRKRNNYLSHAMHKLRFQQKKHKQPKEPASPTKIFRGKLEPVRKREVFTPAQLLAQLIHMAYRNNQQYLKKLTFSKIRLFSDSKAAELRPLFGLVRVLNGKLCNILDRVRIHFRFSKRMFAIQTPIVDTRYKNMSAERQRQLNLQIEDLKNTKNILNRRHQKNKTTIEEAVHKITFQIEEAEVQLLEQERKLQRAQQMECIQSPKPNIDHFQLLRKMYIEAEKLPGVYCKRSILLKKSGINISNVADWAEFQLSINDRLKKQLKFAQSDVEKEPISQHPKMQALEVQTSHLKNLVREYVRDSYRYLLIDRLKPRYEQMQKDYDAIGMVLQRGDWQALKQIFQMI